MVNLSFKLILILVILLSVASCSPATAILPNPTDTKVPLPSPTSTTAPTDEPTISALPTPSNSPTAIPVSSDLYLPNGIATFISGSGNVTYYDLQGQLVGTLQASNIGTGAYQQAVIAGRLTLPPSADLPPLVYFAFENGGELWQNINNDISLLKSAPNMLNMIGAPGNSIITYTLLDYVDAGLHSQLFVADLQELSTAMPMLENTNTEIYAIKPLRISMNEDQPSGIWYTTVPYGIGGDIVFEPRKTLSYLNLTDYQIKSYLDLTKSPVGISDDQTWIAYNSVASTGPLSIAHNFDFDTAVTYPLRPDSDRGSGEAVFSPGNQYVAWREASGSITTQPPSFHETIRIATLDGTILTELPDLALLEASGFTEISWVVPIGWLDSQTLGLEVKGSVAQNVCIISVKADGSGLSYLVPGSFIGFLYP